MNQKHLVLISAAAAWMALNFVYAQSPAMIIPANTDVLIRANETIDSRTADEGRVYAGTVDQDILDSAGNVAIRKDRGPSCSCGRSSLRRSSFWICSRSS